MVFKNPVNHKKLGEYIDLCTKSKQVINITKEINNLVDLIELGKSYDETCEYNYDIKILSNLVPSLTELNNMIGMKNVKTEIVDHILFYIQKLDDKNNDMLHTIIEGPPGVGKTELAKILSKIYVSMGILSNNKIIKADRSMLIGQYLGQTAPKTQKVIDSAIGGVLFIDEVYSLGNSEKKDSYAKECIDTINENLTEKKTEFICIIAGYKDEIENCFLSYNKGLERRFPVRFSINSYTPEELYLIFKKKVYDNNWKLDKNITEQFFIDNYKYFQNYGGDMEILFSRSKRMYSRRVFLTNNNTKILIIDDIEKGFAKQKENKSTKMDSDNENWKNMFL